MDPSLRVIEEIVQLLDYIEFLRKNYIFIFGFIITKKQENHILKLVKILYILKLFIFDIKKIEMTYKNKV